VIVIKSVSEMHINLADSSPLISRKSKIMNNIPLLKTLINKIKTYTIDSIIVCEMSENSNYSKEFLGDRFLKHICLYHFMELLKVGGFIVLPLLDRRHEDTISKYKVIVIFLNAILFQ
jgi:NDP-sugar pyrophosphorylase family protein